MSSIVYIFHFHNAAGGFRFYKGKISYMKKNHFLRKNAAQKKSFYTLVEMYITVPKDF